VRPCAQPCVCVCGPPIAIPPPPPPASCSLPPQIVYTYEYQGNAPKLVHTPLTDKCYLTLTQGMAMGCGGNPYGPAGGNGLGVVLGKRQHAHARPPRPARAFVRVLCVAAIKHVGVLSQFACHRCAAGTGKTESVKALGAALGRQVLVFNCDEGIDFQSMVGLECDGEWGGFWPAPPGRPRVC
jgi:dynein heavy chain 2